MDAKAALSSKPSSRIWLFTHLQSLQARSYVPRKKHTTAKTIRKKIPYGQVISQDPKYETKITHFIHFPCQIA